MAKLQKIDVDYQTMSCVILEQEVAHCLPHTEQKFFDGVIAYIPATDSIVFGFQKCHTDMPYAYSERLFSGITLL